MSAGIQGYLETMFRFLECAIICICIYTYICFEPDIIVLYFTSNDNVSYNFKQIFFLFCGFKLTYIKTKTLFFCLCDS